MIRTLENDQLRVQINDLGAELTEIYDKTNDRQVLWNADPSYWNRHAPVLFPNVGRYYENKCLINGNTYHCGQHGFARDMEFTCTESSQTSVTHLVTSSDSTRETYPFDFRLLITIDQSDNTRWKRSCRHNPTRIPDLPDICPCYKTPVHDIPYIWKQSLLSTASLCVPSLPSHIRQ